MLVPSFFTVEEMQPAIKAVEECVDILANRLYLAGKGKVQGRERREQWREKRAGGRGWMDRWMGGRERGRMSRMNGWIDEWMDG